MLFTIYCKYIVHSISMTSIHARPAVIACYHSVGNLGRIIMHHLDVALATCLLPNLSSPESRLAFRDEPQSSSLTSTLSFDLTLLRIRVICLSQFSSFLMRSSLVTVLGSCEGHTSEYSIASKFKRSTSARPVPPRRLRIVA